MSHIPHNNIKIHALLIDEISTEIDIICSEQNKGRIVAPLIKSAKTSLTSFPPSSPPPPSPTGLG